MRWAMARGRDSLARAAALVLLALPLWPRPAAATLVESMSLPELLAAAELVAVVEAVDADHVAADAEGIRVVTQVRMRVINLMKGTLGPGADGHLDVVVPGGTTASGHTQEVVGAPRLPVGGMMVLFLSPAPSRTGEYLVVGLGQGAWHLDADSLPIRPETPIWQHERPRTGTRRVPAGVPRTFGHLQETVLELVDAGHL